MPDQNNLALWLIGFILVGQVSTALMVRGVKQVLTGYNGEEGLIKRVSRLGRQGHDHANDILALKFRTGMMKPQQTDREP